MYSTAVLLNKISPTRDGRTMTLADLQHLSFSELRKTFDDQLSWGESHYLYREAVEQKKRHRLLEARIFTRAIRRGIERDSASRSYDEMFGSRSSSFVNPGSVASMFSPAGYLTELYREAKNLHFASSAYHLDNRRPDLAGLALSQSNMDTEISTLARHCLTNCCWRILPARPKVTRTLYLRKTSVKILRLRILHHSHG
ncbi:Tc toxin subunit A [Xenorhabdus bovienii]|uniref:Tc toxin subunit A n=1 Tax=Xenorhabdus bovienii TaxID=40576 RepID=UPI000AA5DE0F|nr:Tc toxin subunit A [Xenorhabdus bovienii]